MRIVKCFVINSYNSFSYNTFISISIIQILIAVQIKNGSVNNVKTINKIKCGQNIGMAKGIIGAFKYLLLDGFITFTICSSLSKMSLNKCSIIISYI